MSHREHPENDLHDDADTFNRQPPEPHSFDELADAPDPILLRQRNQASTRQAIVFLIVVIFGSALVSFLLALIFRLTGGPLCSAGPAVWLCSRSAEIWWGIGSCLVPVSGLIANAVIMVRKLNTYTRWRPWMGVFWVLVPYAMIWMTTVGQRVIIGLTS